VDSEAGPAGIFHMDVKNKKPAQGRVNTGSHDAGNPASCRMNTTSSARRWLKTDLSKPTNLACAVFTPIALQKAGRTRDLKTQTILRLVG